MVAARRAPEADARAALLAVDGVRGVDASAAAAAGDGVLAVECAVDGRAGIEAAIARAMSPRWDLFLLRRREATLENVFLRYVRESGAAEAAA